MRWTILATAIFWAPHNHHRLFDFARGNLVNVQPASAITAMRAAGLAMIMAVFKFWAKNNPSTRTFRPVSLQHLAQDARDWARQRERSQSRGQAIVPCVSTAGLGRPPGSRVTVAAQ